MNSVQIISSFIKSKTEKQQITAYDEKFIIDVRPITLSFEPSASQPPSFSFPHSHRGVGVGPYGPEAAFPLPNSQFKNLCSSPHALCPAPHAPSSSPYAFSQRFIIYCFCLPPPLTAPTGIDGTFILKGMHGGPLLGF